MKLEVSDETASQLVVDDLKASYEVCSAYDDTKTMEALCTVLEYYMVPAEYRQWRGEGVTTDSTPFIVVNEIEEHEDGSATAVIDTSREGTRMLVERGLVSLLKTAIDKGEVSFEQETPSV